MSVISFILFFGPLQNDRKNGRFTSSEIAILLLATSSLISTYFTLEKFLQALNYIQYSPYEISPSPTTIFRLYFELTFLPLVVTTIIFLVVCLNQKKTFQSDF